jgi:uncharacterized protein (TIRG00374 family)
MRAGWLRAGLTVLFLAALLMLVDRQSLAAILWTARPLPLAMACLLFLGCCFLASCVWWVMLRAVGLSTTLWNSFRLNLMGFLLNNLIPSGLGGDMWRAWIFARQKPPTPLGASFATVIADRWIAFAALVLLTAAMVPLAQPALRGFPVKLSDGLTVDLGDVALLFMAAMLGVFMVSVVLFSPLAHRGRTWLAARAASAQVMAGHIDEFLSTLLEYRGKWKWLAAAAAISILSPLAESVAYWLLARAIDVHVSLLAFIVLTPVLRVIHHLPLTIDAIGTQDVAVILMARAFGMTVEQGLALSLLIHASKLSVSALGMPMYAWMAMRPRDFDLTGQSEGDGRLQGEGPAA